MKSFDELPKRRQVFIKAYIECLNASEAARKAGYSKPGQEGHRLLQMPDVSFVVAQMLGQNNVSPRSGVTPIWQRQRHEVADWLDVLIRARQSGDLAALAVAVDAVIEQMSDLIF